MASVATCDKTSALPPNLIIQWSKVRWIGGHSSLAMKSRQSDLPKLETWNGKNDSTPMNNLSRFVKIKINRPKLIGMCGYKVATNPQNFTEIYLAWVKILQKVWDYFYDSHCILPHIFSLIISIINPFRRSGDIITTKTLLRVCAARRVMTRVLKGSHVSFTCIPRVHPLTEWAIPAFAFPAEAGPHLPTLEWWKLESRVCPDVW